MNAAASSSQAAPPRPFAVTAQGLSVTVRLTPRGGRDALEGASVLADGSCVLKARVRAAATEGEANAALIALLARSAGVAPRNVTLLAGAAARIKRLAIAGDGARLAAALQSAAGL